MIASPRNNLPVGLALFHTLLSAHREQVSAEASPVSRVSRQSGASAPHLCFSVEHHSRDLQPGVFWRRFGTHVFSQARVRFKAGDRPGLRLG